MQYKRIDFILRRIIYHDLWVCDLINWKMLRWTNYARVNHMTLIVYLFFFTCRFCINYCIYMWFSHFLLSKEIHFYQVSGGMADEQLVYSPTNHWQVMVSCIFVPGGILVFNVFLRRRVHIENTISLFTEIGAAKLYRPMYLNFCGDVPEFFGCCLL